MFKLFKKTPKEVSEGDPGKVITGTIVPPSDDPDSKPIDQEVWYKLSRSWVTGADERLQKQAESIQNTIKWFFGLGSSATVLGIFFKDPKLERIDGLLFGGVLLCLMIAYALATLSTTTISKSIAEPNSAECIQETFNKSNNRAKFYIVTSSFFMFLGMALIAPALVQSFKQTNTAPEAIFSGSYTVKTVGEKKYIKNIHLSCSALPLKTIMARVDAGSTMSNAIHVLHFSHTAIGTSLDLVHPVYGDTMVIVPKPIFL